MAKRTNKQIALAQHFLKSSKAAELLRYTSTVTPSDTIYEIGAGTGMITAELARVARKVVAIEKDSALVQRLHERFRQANNIHIVAGDYLHYRIADRFYKIIANIPYNQTTDIIRKILYQPPIPEDAYLIIQQEAAEKISGLSKETQFSILAKPCFTFQLVHHLQRTDFQPTPNVESVFLHIHKRSPPLLFGQDYDLYHRFVCFGFGRWKKNLKLAFKPIFTYEQWKRLSKELDFPLDATATNLTFEQWLGLFNCFQQRVSIDKQVLVKTR